MRPSYFTVTLLLARDILPMPDWFTAEIVNEYFLPFFKPVHLYAFAVPLTVFTAPSLRRTRYDVMTEPFAEGIFQVTVTWRLPALAFGRADVAGGPLGITDTAPDTWLSPAPFEAVTVKR